jgi:hypothetical protein
MNDLNDRETEPIYENIPHDDFFPCGQCSVESTCEVACRAFKEADSLQRMRDKRKERSL